MELSKERVQSCTRRLLLARTSILAENGFYGVLLMHMKFALGFELDTAWTDGDTITFNPDFMDKLSDSELCFILEHEVLHAALGHPVRGRGKESHLDYNLACDIVVNSNIKKSHGGDSASITITCGAGESYHLAPDGCEGERYTAEEVYEMIRAGRRSHNGDVPGSGAAKGKSDSDCDSQGGDSELRMESVRKEGRGGRIDWHIEPSSSKESQERVEAWPQIVKQAAEAMRVRDPENARGLVPACCERMLEEMRESGLDWRELLADFIQEEICDYSFNPPDRRFQDSPFLLPDFNDVDQSVRNILFMVDTSASITDEMIRDAYSEMKGAIDQFEGKLAGWIGFFDARFYSPKPFEDVEDLFDIKPVGGGGTGFDAVFECLDACMDADEVSCIVILTDGLARFPEESRAHGIPVLWLMSGNYVRPPWGRVTRMEGR